VPPFEGRHPSRLPVAWRAVNRSELIAAARAWIAGDPDPETRSELEALIAADDLTELADRMAGTLRFGTAGLRGRVEAGSNRMNRATVIRTTKGVADWLAAHGRRGPVVVGRDARLSSEAFMADTVAVLVAAGIDVRFLPEPTPTPVIAYAARKLEADAAIAITASHNPPADNGYKVYGSNAVQIIPPVDTEIASAIDRVGRAIDVPRADDPYGHPLSAPLDLWDAYMADLRRLLPPERGSDTLDIVYTPLHGVGGPWTTGALARFGFTAVHTVADQFQPDGRFPTVAFPNPEEPGALDLAETLAARVSADLVIANDPDTDRLAVSLPVAEGFRKLTGNQIGVLLADFLLCHTDLERPILVNTVVSSPMLGAVAEAVGAVHVVTLTGFKWIWNAVLDLEAAGEGRFLFAYEEALGYSVWPAVRDKDGISAAVVFAQLAAEEAARGRTVWDRLDDLYRRFGVWVSVQHSVVRPGPGGTEEIEAAMTRLGSTRPSTLGGLTVTGIEDYRIGAERRPRWLPATPLVEYRLDGGRALVRPSGTEPKLKVYVDLGEPARRDLRAQEAALTATADAVALDLVRFAGVS